jgi:hypothetical protein
MDTTMTTKELIQKKYPDLISKTKPYHIHPYTKLQAKKLNVSVKPSEKDGKKIDVYDKNGDYLVSVGARGYSDFPTYRFLESKGIYPDGHADKRRKLYKKRHDEYRKIKGSPSYFADKLLW